MNNHHRNVKYIKLVCTVQHSKLGADYSMLQCPPIANNTIVQEYDDEGTDGGDLNFAGEEEQEVRRMQPTCQGTVESVHCVGMVGVQYVLCDPQEKPGTSYKD